MSAESESRFPDFIRALPRPDSPLEGLEAWMLQTGQAMAMFFELPDGVVVPEHAHGAQWGVVLEGTLEFTIGGETRTYERGDTYVVPAGVAHSAIIHPGYMGIDVFADADRYRPREHPPESRGPRRAQGDPRQKGTTGK